MFGMRERIHITFKIEINGTLYSSRNLNINNLMNKIFHKWKSIYANTDSAAVFLFKVSEEFHTFQ